MTQNLTIWALNNGFTKTIHPDGVTFQAGPSHCYTIFDVNDSGVVSYESNEEFELVQEMFMSVQEFLDWYVTD